MAQYRFEILGEDNQLVGMASQDCVDDLTALQVARTMCRSNAVRILRGNREVAHLNCGDTDHTSGQREPG